MSNNIIKINDLLIKSIHSNKEAEEYFEQNLNNRNLYYMLLEIIKNIDLELISDIHLEATYWISMFNSDFIKETEDELLNLIEIELDSIVCPIMVALSKIKSKKALNFIIERRLKPEKYWEAISLENYFK